NKEVGMSAIHQPDPTSRIILGIDPGVAIVGYAVVEARGDVLRMIACDVIRTPAGLPLAPRLQLIYHQLGGLVSSYRPQDAAMQTGGARQWRSQKKALRRASFRSEWDRRVFEVLRGCCL